MAHNEENEFDKSTQNLSTNNESNTEIIEDSIIENVDNTENSDVSVSNTAENYIETVDENAENAEESNSNDESEDNENSEYTSQFGELEGFVEGYEKNDFDGGVAVDVMPEKKKKMEQKTLVTIIVVVTIVIIGLAVGGYFVFFNKSIQGTWMEEGEDGVNTYYVFKGNSFEIISGNEYTTQKNVYSDVQYDGSTMSIMAYGEVYMRFTYSVSGNLIQGKTLSLTMEGYESSGAIELKNAWNVDVPQELSGPEFKKNDDIIGIWKGIDTDGYVDYIVFDENGNMTQVMGDNSRINETKQKYSFDGSQINMKYEDQEYSVTASVDGEKLQITSFNQYTYTETVMNYEKTTQEEYDKVLSSLEARNCEIPTMPATESSTSSTEATTEVSTSVEGTESDVESTEASSETVTEAVTTAQ
ncbi:MAG: hypothetical protein UH239_03785 [Acutalibacteraceae bacterium]|nr:hypothetical protein [Acutalibacteraceae bacterium]